MGATSTAAEAVIGFLAERGVRRCYCVPGESFLELIQAAECHPDMELVSARHESGAAFMAEAEATLTGTPAVVMATRAVGASNAAIGVYTACADRTPMVVLLGQVENASLGREAFQEIDLPAFYGQVTARAETVRSAAQAAEAIARAYAAATGPRPGPAALAFPVDVLAGECPQAATVGRAAPLRPTPAAASAVDEALRGAEAPVVIAGRGAQRDHAPLVRLAERYGLGVYTAFRRQDAFPNSHPHYLGHLTLGADPAILEPLRRADLVVAAGTRLDEVTTQSYRLPGPRARVIAVDPGDDVPGADPAIRAGVPEFVAGVLACTGPAVPRDLSGAHQTYLQHSTPLEAASSTPGTVHPAQVVAAMRRALAGDAVLVNDAGNFSIFCHRYWRFEHPASQLSPASGAMGYAVPAAVGAALAAPERRVVALAGDGGFLMTGHELETAARCRLPITVLVFVNRCYGTIAAHQLRRGLPTSGVHIGPVDIAGYARALGAEGLDVREAADLDAALAAPAAGPTVLAMHTDPDVLSPGLTRGRAGTP